MIGNLCARLGATNRCRAIQRSPAQTTSVEAYTDRHHLATVCEGTEFTTR